MKKIIFGVLICLSSITHGAELAAPFGYEWGDTQKHLAEVGIIFGKCEASGNNITICDTKNAPKPVSFGEVYILLFDSNTGLQKVSLAGTTINSDIAGQEGKNSYNEIKETLTKKYGKPKSYEYSGYKLYKEYDEFYQCLNYEGCGSWTSIWNISEGGAVVLELNGSGRGKGYISLIYESKNWGLVLDAVKKEKNNSDSSAL